MTNREFYNAIVKGEMTEEVQNFAVEAIAKLNARNEKRNSKPSKTAIANEPIKAQILEFIKTRGEKCIASAIAEGVGVSTAKASALCRQLVEERKILESDVKVPKQGKRRAYEIA